MIHSCKLTKGADDTPATVEEATKLLNKQNKKKAKKARKAQKQAYKEFWARQTKEARRSIKKNKRTQKRIEKARRRSEY
jgi:topoisomerase IA-like protein